MAYVPDIDTGHPQLREVFIRGLAGEDANAAQKNALMNPLFYRVFNISGSAKSLEIVGCIPGLPLMTVRTDPDSTITALALTGGNQKTFTHSEYVQKVTIARSRQEDDPGTAAALVRIMGNRARDTLEYLCAYIILNGTSSSLVPTALGEALFSATHSLTVTGGTGSNYGTTALGHTALGVIWGSMMATSEDNGVPVSYTPRTLVVHPQNIQLGYGTTRAAYQSDALQPAYPLGLTLEVSRFLTDTNDYAVFADKAEHTVQMFLRVAPSLESTVDEANLQDVHVSRLRVSCGASDWRGTYYASVT
jgi:hypothetical protein